MRTGHGSAKEHEIASWQFALIHTGLGNNDEAFNWLEKSYDNREFIMALLRVGETLGSLRDDPRFDDLLQRIGLPIL